MPDQYEPAGYCPSCGYRVDPGRCPECGTEVRRPRKRSPQVTRRRWALGILIVVALAAGAGTIYHYRVPLAVRYWPAWHITQLSNKPGWLARWACEVYSCQLMERLNAEEAAYQQREIAIRAELETLGAHDWAGEYLTHGGNGGSSLLLAPASGFVFRSDSCESYELNHGDIVQVDSDAIILRPAIDPDAYGIGPSQNLIRAIWRGRKFLIQQTELERFLNDVNSRDPGAPAWYMCRNGDPTQDEPKWPKLPPAYNARVLRESLEAQVVGVGTPRVTTGNCVELLITIDAGSDKRAYPGMRLYTRESGELSALTLRTVRPTESEGTYVNCDVTADSEWLPKAGWHFAALGYFIGPHEGFEFELLAP
jgi:hypothetical protein